MKNLLILLLAVPFILGAAKLGSDAAGEYPVPLEAMNEMVCAPDDGNL